MNKKTSPRLLSRTKRKIRVRKRIVGSDARPRLCVFKSLKFTYAQLISDQSGKVLASISSRTVVADNSSAQSVESAKIVGQKIAEVAKEQKIASVVFDRNGYRYHGRVAAVADGARESGLQV